VLQDPLADSQIDFNDVYHDEQGRADEYDESNETQESCQEFNDVM